MASGDTLVVWHAAAALIELTTDAALGIRAGIPHLAFDSGSNETARFMAVMPSAYGGGGVDVILHCSTSATTGDVDIDVEFEDQTGLDLDTDSFGPVTSQDANSVPVTDGLEFSVTVSVTDGANMDNVVAGDPFRLRVTRDATNDSAASDLQVRMVELVEQ